MGGFLIFQLQLQLAHVSETKFTPLKYLTVHIVILVFLCLGVVEVVTGRRMLKPSSVWPIFAFMFLVWFHMVVHVIDECCEALHIRAFCISSQTDDSLSQNEVSGVVESIAAGKAGIIRLHRRWGGGGKLRPGGFFSSFSLYCSRSNSLLRPSRVPGFQSNGQLIYNYRIWRFQRKRAPSLIPTIKPSPLSDIVLNISISSST